MKTILLAAGALARVHLSGQTPDDDLLLEQQVSDRTWELVCAAPCDRDLDPRAFYRVRGPGIPRSRPFQLGSSADGNVDLRVRPGSKLGVAGGVVLLVAGVGSLAVGSFALFMGMLGRQQDFATGALFMGAAAGGIAGGASLVSTYGRTHVEQAIAPVMAAAPKPVWIVPLVSTTW